MKHIKKFERHSDYDIYRNSQSYISPNVSYCADFNEIHLEKSKQQTDDESQTPMGLIGFVVDKASKINFFFSDKDVTNYPSSSKRQSIVLPICQKFPEVPSNARHYEDKSVDSSDSPEEGFIMNTVLSEYTLVQAVDVKRILLRILSTQNLSHTSIAIMDPSKGDSAYMVLPSTWKWWTGIQTHNFDIASLDGYTTDKKFFLICNAKKSGGNGDLNMTSPLEFRKDFDIIIMPNSWRIETLFSGRVYYDYFDYTGQWPGGMVIYKNYLIQLFTSGKILVLNRATNKVLATGIAECASNDMHGNALSLGTTTPSGSTIPYLYISQWTSGSCICHVEKINISGRTVRCQRIQRIGYSGRKFKTTLNWDWSVDSKTGYLWAIGYAASASNRYGAKVALKFNIPDLDSPIVSLTDNDIIDEYSFTFPGAQQDIHIENDFAFWCFSYNNSIGTGGVLMIDLANHTLLSDTIIDMQSIEREPQGVFREGSNLYVTSHQSGFNMYDLSLHKIDLLQTNIGQ